MTRKTRETGTAAAVRIDSEIGVLESVVVHTPGPEIEAMTPKTAVRLLYNDIIPLSVVKREHEILRSFLRLVCTVHEVEPLLVDILAVPEVRKEFIHTVTGFFRIPQRREELSVLEPADLARAVICGLRERKETLTSFLSESEFDFPPLPNLFFTRDYGMVFRNKVLTGSMANTVRRLEALLIRFVFLYHPEFRNGGILFDGALKTNPEITIEGGDFLVVSPDTLVIGISERTTTQAVDLLVDRFVTAGDIPVTIFAVLLPKERATIHLDMAFTLVDRTVALVHEPVILGKDRAPVIRISIDAEGNRTLERIDSLLQGLAAAGYAIEPILCGGPDPRLQQREQWIAGANSFAFGPGRFILYDCNEATLHEVEKAGYPVAHAERFVRGEQRIEDWPKLAVAVPGVELARGGGGIRCMTMPVRRRTI